MLPGYPSCLRQLVLAKRGEDVTHVTASAKLNVKSAKRGRSERRPASCDSSLPARIKRSLKARCLILEPSIRMHDKIKLSTRLTEVEGGGGVLPSLLLLEVGHLKLRQCRHYAYLLRGVNEKHEPNRKHGRGKNAR